MSCRSSSDSVRISRLNITENSSKGGLSKIVYYLSLKKFQDRNLRTSMVVLHHQVLWLLLSVPPSQFMMSKFYHPVGQNNCWSSSHHICVPESCFIYTSSASVGLHLCSGILGLVTPTLVAWCFCSTEDNGLFLTPFLQVLTEGDSLPSVFLMSS